jgi:hypothetical protein
MSSFIYELFKIWKPDLDWLCNETAYEFSSGPISIRCEQLPGHGRYKTTIAGLPENPDVCAVGASCYEAICNAIELAQKAVEDPAK